MGSSQLIAKCSQGQGGVATWWYIEEVMGNKSSDYVFLPILDRSYNEFGRMWEYPDMFRLDGRDIIITSPQDMRALGLEFHSGNCTMALMGSLKDGQFLRENVQAIDYGLDFYAPLTADGISFECSGQALIRVEKYDIITVE